MSNIIKWIIEWIPVSDCFIMSFDNWCDKYLTKVFLPLGFWHIGICLLLGLFVAILIYSKKYKIWFEWIEKRLVVSSIFVWFAGFVVYMVGMYRYELNALAIVPRAIIASFKMFAVTNEQARVSTIMQNDAIYMTLFSIVHILAAFITFLFIFKMIGYKMRSYLAIRDYNASDKDVHLFWGVNQASCLLAKNIRLNKSNDTIIFIDVDKECENNCQKKPSLNFITNTITITDAEMSLFEEIDALVDHCYNGPASIDTSVNDDVFGQLKLNNICKILQKCNSLNIYLLSDDETDNISSALVLQDDKHLKTLVKEKSSPIIFVHARRDSYNEVFAHYSQYASDSKKMKIKVVDSAYLSIQSLKQDVSALPVNCVKPNTQTGTVDSPFTAMVVGFGATGQEAFNFLYEFASFIDSNKKKTPFKCYAFDEKMDKIEGLIRAKIPAITEDELTLIKTSVDTDIFWGRVKLLINDLNYIVVALNNDTLGMTLAVNLFKYALRYRDANLPQLKIMLRCYDRSNETRMTIVKEKLNDSIVIPTDFNPCNNQSLASIQIFASSDKLFTYENVVSNLTLLKAKEFNKVYEGSTLSAEALWEKCFGNSKIEKIITDKHTTRYHALYEINTKISQNISNALHCKTKLALMGITLDNLNNFHSIVNSRKPQTTNYVCNQQEETLLSNLALVEHERWIASHKLMGFKYGASKDYVKKHHKCMCDFDQLDVETQSYDCNVVDTTIKLASNEVTELYVKLILQVIDLCDMIVLLYRLK